MTDPTEPTGAADESATDATDAAREGAATEATDAATDAAETPDAVDDADALALPDLGGLEAMLFAAERPLTVTELAEWISAATDELVTEGAIDAALTALAARYDTSGAGIELAQAGGGYTLRTRGTYGTWITKMYKKRPVRLSRAALEVLAIVAYRQPCTRAVVDDIRGVDSSSTLRQLLERELLRILGKADDVGRPLLYGTTPRFLEMFGLDSLEALPTLREYTELTDEHLVRVQELEETLAANRAADAGDPTEGASETEASSEMKEPENE